jgi:ATP-dependent DNA helicase RecG
MTAPSKSKQAPQQAWDFDIRFLKGVGEKLGKVLAKADVRSLWDLLLMLPRTYEDRRRLQGWREIEAAASRNEAVLSRGVIERWTAHRAGFGGRKRLEASVRLVEEGPATGAVPYQAHAVDPELFDLAPHLRVAPRLAFTFFHTFGNSLEKRYPPGTTVLFHGKAQGFRNQIQIVHPELQALDRELPSWETGWVPVYREIAGVSTRVLRKILSQALSLPAAQSMPEILPPDFAKKLGLSPLAESLRELHFPTHWEPPPGELKPTGPYFRRVVFEELFLMALALHLRRAEWKGKSRLEQGRVPKIAAPEGWVDRYAKLIPFELTGDQRKALEDVGRDLSLASEPVPMHRLLQGDVGAGKTIVAFTAALAVIDSGYQAAIMAPTEILANQHYQNFTRLFPERAHEALLLKGAMTAKSKKEVRAALAEGRGRFVIGTQALLTDTTGFERLGFVIVDEQHRFGVEQRLGLKHQAEGLLPHLLVMTATPIPRSLALTLYGDLSVSVIREKPKGRIPIRTHIVRKRSFDALVRRLGQFLEEGRQIYLVYPLVEESEELDLKDVQTAFEEWKNRFPDVKIGLLHGRMKAADKEAVMRDFKAGETKVLVSTTVIEVGVDVPNASVIVIEHAERFGLSQLHQLRGRVGRGSKESFCVLVAPDRPSQGVEDRLRVIESSEDGFQIAEKDLEIRGPGEFLGRRQSGLPGFRVAHILRDLETMELAREEARRVLDADPRLEKAENRGLRLMLEKWWGGRMELTLSG